MIKLPEARVLALPQYFAVCFQVTSLSFQVLSFWLVTLHANFLIWSVLSSYSKLLFMLCFELFLIHAQVRRSFHLLLIFPYRYFWVFIYIAGWQTRAEWVDSWNFSIIFSAWRLLIHALWAWQPDRWCEMWQLRIIGLCLWERFRIFVFLSQTSSQFL